MPPLRVVFMPMGTDDNPYQRQLVNALSELECDVIEAGTDTWFLRSALRDWNPDAVHLHWLHPLTLSRSAFLSNVTVRIFLMQLRMLKRRGVRIVWTVHNLTNHERLQPRVDAFASRAVARLADALIVHGEAARARVIEDLRADPGKVHVIPHGHYLEWYAAAEPAPARAELGLPPSGRILLCFGVLRDYKGVDALIEAFGATAPPDWQLLIAGQARPEAYSNQLAGVAAETPGVVYRPGFVARAAVSKYFAVADAVALPYRTHLTSGAALLAMSFGRACLAPASGMFEELLRPDGGVLYDPSERGALRLALEVLCAPGADLERMGARNRDNAGRFDWGGIAARTRELYVRA